MAVLGTFVSSVVLIFSGVISVFQVTRHAIQDGDTGVTAGSRPILLGGSTHVFSRGLLGGIGPLARGWCLALRLLRHLRQGTLLFRR